MQYMLIFTEPQDKFDERQDSVKGGPYWGAWTSYMAAVQKAGIMVSGNGLQPPHTSTVIKIRNGARQVQDGPFADTKEQLGGYAIIEVANIDAALEWAARSPSATYGSVEIRPVLPPPPQS